MNLTGDDTPEGEGEPVRRPQGKPYKRVPDVRSVSLLGVGMVIGAAIGAGVALLIAPDRGDRTRARLRRKVSGETGVWKSLGKELKRAAIAKRKTMEREAELRRIEEERAKADAP
ncbi:MAG TPA: YtxH domain-containing protein [Gemmatimonadaceae bacterium]|nr:YtxH domain-containing protein [Gemmatimonadaceae bacterium]